MVKFNFQRECYSGVRLEENCKKYLKIDTYAYISTFYNDFNATLAHLTL